MSKATELEVLKNDIKVQGCTFSRTGLSLAVVDEETLIHAWTFLASVEVSRAWWFGDYLLAYCEFRLAAEGESLIDEAKRDPKVRVRMFRRYTSEREDIAKVELKTLHEWREVCDFYELARRRGELSNQHHLEAMWGAESGDKAVADDWLQSAVDNKWTVPQLRAAIRKAKQQASEPEEPMPTLHQEELFACARWSRTTSKRVPDMSREEAETLLKAMAPILELSLQLAAFIASADAQAA